MAKLGNFQMLGFRGWASEITKANHLGVMLAQQPQKTGIMVRLLAVNYGQTLDTFLSQYPTKTFDTDDEYTWDIIGSSRKNVPLVEARDENGNAVTSNTTTNVGIGTAPFELVFAEDWFFDGEVLSGNLNELYPMRVLGPARMEGTRAVYKVELMGGITDGIPAERLLPGEKFSVEYAPVERGLSRRVGGVRHTSTVAMRNEFSQIRISDKMSGDMFEKKVAFGVPMVKQDESGKQVRQTETMWMHYENWEIEKQWNEYKNNVLAFGRSNRNINGEYLNFGKSGEAIRMGDGLFAQMESANTYYYNHFSLQLLEDVLYDLCANKIDFSNTVFLLKTGREGAKKFHKEVLDTVSGWTQFVGGSDAAALGVVSKTSSKLHPNSLKAGYQFTEFIAPMGIHVRVDVDPMYDDPVRNKVLINGKPAMSSRFDIFDIGTMDQPNIFKVAAKNRPEARGYEWGLRNPFNGNYGNDHMSYAEDSATVHIMTTTGICVLDGTRTVSLIPAALQG